LVLLHVEHEGISWFEYVTPTELQFRGERMFKPRY